MATKTAKQKRIIKRTATKDAPNSSVEIEDETTVPVEQRPAKYGDPVPGGRKKNSSSENRMPIIDDTPAPANMPLGISGRLENNIGGSVNLNYYTAITDLGLRTYNYYWIMKQSTATAKPAPVDVCFSKKEASKVRNTFAKQAVEDQKAEHDWKWAEENKEFVQEFAHNEIRVDAGLSDEKIEEIVARMKEQREILRENKKNRKAKPKFDAPHWPQYSVQPVSLTLSLTEG